MFFFFIFLFVFFKGLAVNIQATLILKNAKFLAMAPKNSYVIFKVKILSQAYN